LLSWTRQDLLPTLLALPTSLAPAPVVRPPTQSDPDPKLRVQEAFSAQAEILEHMQSEMDALANHLEQVSSAVRDGEEGEEVDGPYMRCIWRLKEQFIDHSGKSSKSHRHSRVVACLLTSHYPHSGRRWTFPTH
jgi:hypothetical protein